MQSRGQRVGAGGEVLRVAGGELSRPCGVGRLCRSPMQQGWGWAWLKEVALGLDVSPYPHTVDGSHLARGDPPSPSGALPWSW